MTDAEQLAATMELGEDQRLALARELLKHRRFVNAMRRHARRLPWQVRELLEAKYPERELDPPPDPALAERLI